MALAPLPSQPNGVPWPTTDWPLGAPSAAVASFLEEMSRTVFSASGSETVGETLSLLVVHGGKLIFEAYGAGVTDTTPLPSWSMAKSITHALTGVLVRDGRLDVMTPAAVPEWRAPADPRGAITLDLLLRMSSGLKFTEVYLQGQPSDVIEMLFGSGQGDVGAFAASFPLAHAPGRFFAYSSGTTNIIARILGDLVGKGPAFHAFMRSELFAPLGMTTPVPRFDGSGTFIGSSYCNSSARDFARFGLLYLRDGIWDGHRILPDGWVDYARTPTFQQPDCLETPYGAHWWLGAGGAGTFSANGYEGQFIIIDPAADLIVVRNGKSPLELRDPLAVFMHDFVAGLRERL